MIDLSQKSPRKRTNRTRDPRPTIKRIAYTFELPDELYAWWRVIDDREEDRRNRLANDLLAVAFERMFSLSRDKSISNYVGTRIDMSQDTELRDMDRDRSRNSVYDITALQVMIQKFFGWMLLELVFDTRFGEVFEVDYVRIMPSDRVLLVRVVRKTKRDLYDN